MSDSPVRRTIDVPALGAGRGYFFLTSVVVPRPIAWVTTVDAAGRPNLAPFSFFQGITGDPPIVMIAINSTKADGSSKDTLANIRATGEWVAHAVSEDLVEPMVLSSVEFAHGESEIAKAGLATFPARRVRPPCLAEAPVALECRLRLEVPMGSSVVMFGDVLLAHVREDLLDARGNVDPDRLRPLGRLGAPRYENYGGSFAKKPPA